MNARSKTATGLVLSWLVLFVAAGLALVGYALPRQHWERLGSLEVFPPSVEPYPITSMDRFVYLVNDGQQVIVLDSMNRQDAGYLAGFKVALPSGVNVRWNAIEAGFVDPNRGSWFNLYGIPQQRGKLPFENQSLPRYPVKLEDGVIYVDLTRSEVIKLK